MVPLQSKEEEEQAENAYGSLSHNRNTEMLGDDIEDNSNVLWDHISK